MLNITQSDVTHRVNLETAMAHLAERHIEMLAQVWDAEAMGLWWMEDGGSAIHYPPFDIIP